MVDIGKNLEAIARHHTYDSDLRQTLAERLDRLSGYIYLFSLEMLQTLQRRDVGGLMAPNSEHTSRGSNVVICGKALAFAGQPRSRAVRASERRPDNRAP
jgi:hypothetical protein